MKPALIAAIMLSFVVHLAPRSKPQEHSAEQAQSPREKHPATITAVPTHPPANPQNRPQNDNRSAQAQSPRWYESAEWVLVIVGVITAFVIGWQSWETRKTAIGAKHAADVALLNAQAVLNSERPWLVVTVEKNDRMAESYFFFRITNKGRTPARLVSANFSHNFRATANELSTPPDWEPFIAPNNRLLVTDDHFDIQTTWSNLNTGINPMQIIKSRPVNQGPSTDILFFYGNVVYEDVLGKERPGYALHETRWCFAFFTDGHRFVATSPDGERGKEYSGHT